MDNHSARLILSAYRPDGSDASDETFAAALELARRDPELARWLESQRDLDARVSHALQSVTPPASLRDTLLLAGTLRAAPRPQPHPARWLAAAALLAAAVLAIALWFRPAPDPGAIPLSAVTSHFLQLKREDRISLGVLSHDPARVRSWLHEHGVPDGYTIPPRIAQQPPLGCQVLDVRGQQVALLCFRSGEQVLHLLVIPRRHLVDAPADGTPTLSRDGDIAYATWSRGDRSYVLVSRTTPAALQRWL